MSILKKYSDQNKLSGHDVMTLEEYLELCKSDMMAYASIAERMVKAIGRPEVIDTSEDTRLSKIFLNRTIKRYPAFADFHGMEDVIERIVGYFIHAAQGLEERKQVLYLLGPVGGGKSSLAERLKDLAEVFPIYALATYKGKNLEISPVFETPLGIFNPHKYAKLLSEDFNIPARYFTGLASPWAVKRLDEHDQDLSKFRVVKIYPNKLRRIGVVKTEPGDDNNQDISSLVGKVDIRQLEHFSQDDPDAYSFSGALCRGNQGVVEFVEMFKAPIKVLHPLLTATQEGNYIGTEAISAIPFNGIVLAHSNESEWQTFRNNKNNEAFLDRICVVKVPYCLRVDEEVSIYKKMLEGSNLSGAPCAPKTLEMLAQFSILTRLTPHENSNLYSKMRVYNGENLRDIDPRAKNVMEYRDVAGVDEGMNGTSTRFAFKILSNTYNFDQFEIAADPVHLMMVLEQTIKRQQFGIDMQNQYLEFIKEYLAPKFAEELGNEIQKAYLESYSEYGQSQFDNYVLYADHWIDNTDYKDPDTGMTWNRDVLNRELEKIEKPAGISNPKDFRNEVVKFVLRQKANGKDVIWTSYEKLREVIEKKLFSATEDLLPVISFGSKKDGDTEKKHSDFIVRMTERGYTERQTRRLVEWYIRSRKSS
jgi:serine protein kinase